MSRLLILLLAVVNIAHAECYLRSESVSKMNAKIEDVADMQRSVLPDGPNQVKCVIQFRAWINNRWWNAEGSAAGASNTSIDQICARALDVSRVSVLRYVAGESVESNQAMVCTDQPLPKLRRVVSVGETINRSEVRKHPYHTQSFLYRGSLCQWFIESRPYGRNVEMSQGIICQDYATKTWKVVDKWGVDTPP